MITPVKNQPKVLFAKKIWDQAPYNAFTDLIRFNNQWLLCFREADSFFGEKEGQIRILSSKDGKDFVSIALIKESGYDLRDPKFSITPHQELLLQTDALIYSEDIFYFSKQTHVTFSKNGSDWGPLSPILEPHHCISRLTFIADIGYTVAFNSPIEEDDEEEQWTATLYQTLDGLDYDPITSWEIPGYPSETVLRFMQGGEMTALVRRDGFNDNKAWVGMSEFPYDDWTFHETAHHIEGGNFLISDQGFGYAAARFVMPTAWGSFAKVGLATMGPNYLSPVLFLPSFGDCGSCGMAFFEGSLYISYYSSHEGDAAIYFAKVQI